MKLRHRVNVETNQKQYKFIWYVVLNNWRSATLCLRQHGSRWWNLSATTRNSPGPRLVDNATAVCGKHMSLTRYKSLRSREGIMFLMMQLTICVVYRYSTAVCFVERLKRSRLSRSSYERLCDCPRWQSVIRKSSTNGLWLADQLRARKVARFCKKLPVATCHIDLRPSLELPVRVNTESTGSQSNGPWPWPWIVSGSNQGW